jgi:hypothetical protein
MACRIVSQPTIYRVPLTTITFRKVCSILLRAIHKRGPLSVFPHFSRCVSCKDLSVTEHFMYLLYNRSCFVVAWHSDFSNARFCVPYFRNPGTGTSAASFDVSHSTAHTCCRAANFTDTSSAKRELFMNTVRKAWSMKTTLPSTRFVQIATSKDQVCWLPWSPGQLTLFALSSHSLLTILPPDNSELASELLYDWRFTANQFILASNPLRITTRDVFSTESLRS